MLQVYLRTCRDAGGMVIALNNDMVMMNERCAGKAAVQAGDGHGPARRRAGAIQPADLPPECWTVCRRLLSPLEAIERDAIVQALLDSGGNKLKAAKALGMSRATIYRNMHEFGIVTPSS